ncbi:MFS transporter [Paraburkholderia sp. J7]|uniref:MFS transporter n=1 Tax=Paraburkholderia sp. J7 TaxID=2805438 RepID=UPI002AB69D89|nr:MFS transporter [Paraburkholderia sp. J7]
MGAKNSSATTRSVASAQFVAMAYTLGTIMAGATIASPLYPLYEQTFHIGPSGVTVAYTMYMAGTLLALLFLGHLSDHIGHIRTLRVATILALAGLLVSAFAPDLAILSIGRFMIGVAAGIASTSATAGLVAVTPPERMTFASSIGALMTIIGLGAGPLAGGFIAQSLPFPLHLPYWALAGALSIALVALLRYGASDRPTAAGRFIPRLRFHVPSMHHGRQFATVAVITFTGYTLFSLFASLAPSFFNAFMPWKGPAVGGIGVALLFAGSAAAQMTLQGMSPRRGLVIGSLIVTAGLAMLAISVKISSGLLFVASDLLGGFGQGLAFMSALFVVNAIATPERRAGMISSFFTVAYLGGIVPVLGLGIAADRFGLNVSLIGLCVVMAILAISLALTAQRLFVTDRVQAR